jgi:hypothetical protein
MTIVSYYYYDNSPDSQASTLTHQLQKELDKAMHAFLFLLQMLSASRTWSQAWQGLTWSSTAGRTMSHTTQQWPV